MPVRNIAILFLLIALTACASTEPARKSADVLFSEGEELYASKNYEEAIAQWKRVKETYSSPELTTRAELKIADAQFDSGNYIEAAASYEDFRKLHPAHEKAPYALYRLGLCHFNQITGIDTDQTPVTNALLTFQSFLRQYPTSEYADDVRQRVEMCETKQFQHEIYVGRFYLRTEKYAAAIQRLEEALGRFPRNPFGDEALYYLGQAYLLTGEKTKGRETYVRLTNDYSSSRFIEKAKEFLDKNY